MRFFLFLTSSENSFDGQEAGEQVLLVTRRHPFFLSVKVLFLIVLAVVPFILASAYAPFLSQYAWFQYAWIFFVVWWLFLWQLAFYAITMHLLDVWIVTDRRVIDRTQHGFFTRTVAELPYARIQDVSVSVHGLIQTFFDIGDLELQSAGATQRFKCPQIAHPGKVREVIMGAVHQKAQL